MHFLLWLQNAVTYLTNITLAKGNLETNIRSDFFFFFFAFARLAICCIIQLWFSHSMFIIIFIRSFVYVAEILTIEK